MLEGTGHVVRTKKTQCWTTASSRIVVGCVPTLWMIPLRHHQRRLWDHQLPLCFKSKHSRTFGRDSELLPLRRASSMDVKDSLSSPLRLFADGSVSCELTELLEGQREIKASIAHLVEAMTQVRREIEGICSPASTYGSRSLNVTWRATKAVAQSRAAEETSESECPVSRSRTLMMSPRGRLRAPLCVPAHLLPSMWPASLRFRKGYELDVRNLRQREPSEGREESDREGSSSTSTACPFLFWSCCVLHPDAWFQFVFEVLGLCVLLIDVSMVAYFWAWDVQVEGFWQTLTVLFASFWIVDILANFSTGSVGEGLRDIFQGSKPLKSRQWRVGGGFCFPAPQRGRYAPCGSSNIHPSVGLACQSWSSTAGAYDNSEILERCERHHAPQSD